MRPQTLDVVSRLDRVGRRVRARHHSVGSNRRGAGAAGSVGARVQLRAAPLGIGDVVTWGRSASLSPSRRIRPSRPRPGVSASKARSASPLSGIRSGVADRRDRRGVRRQRARFDPPPGRVGRHPRAAASAGEGNQGVGSEGETEAAPSPPADGRPIGDTQGRLIGQRQLAGYGYRISTKHCRRIVHRAAVPDYARKLGSGRRLEVSPCRMNAAAAD